jgi:hypothetical protein
MLLNETAIRKNFIIRDLWDKQHPIIHAWFLMSTISIFCMSALFFIVP